MYVLVNLQSEIQILKTVKPMLRVEQVENASLTEELLNELESISKIELISISTKTVEKDFTTDPSPAKK